MTLDYPPNEMSEQERSFDQAANNEHRLVAPATLSHHELEFRVAALDATAIFSLTDLKGCIIEVNDKFCDISGYSRADLIGQNHRMLKSGKHSTETFRQMYRTIARGETWRGELLNRAKDGRLYWVDTTIIPRRDERGTLVAYSAIQLDITERKKTEEGLRLSETLLRSTLTALSEGIVVQDAFGQIISCNPAAERILGVGQDELSGVASADPRWQAIREDGRDFPGNEHPAMIALATGEPQNQIVMGLRRSDGSVTWISINSVPIFVEGKTEPNSVVTSFSDITARKLAQEILTEAIGATPDGFVIFDNNDRLVVCNEAYKEIYSASAPAIEPGITFTDLLRYGIDQGQYPQAGETKQQHSTWLTERTKQHRASKADVVQQLADGRWLQIRERHTPSDYIVGFRTDVTELKRETAKLQAVIDNFPGGISFLDASYNIVACNDTFRTLLDLPGDLFRKGLLSLETIIRANAVRGEYGPGDPDEQVRTRMELARKGEPHLFERTRPDGTVLEVRGTPIQGGGFITTYTDVTARHAAEQQLTNGERQAREKSATLQLTLAHMSQGLSMFDAEGRLIVWNDRYVEIYGLPPDFLRQGVSLDAIRERRPRSVYLGSDEPDWRQNLAENCSSMLRFDDGRTIKIVSTPIQDSGWVATHEDISEQIRAEKELFEQAKELALTNMRFDAALSNMSQGLCLFDANKHLVISNKRFREIYNLADDQIRPGMSLSQMLELQVPIAQGTELTLDQYVEKLPAQLNQVYRLADGRAISMQRTPTPDGGWVATHEDITERERSDQKISHLAYHDVLTGLANRAEFKTRGDAALSRAISRDEHISVLLIDLDRFKAVNDTFGHAAGDKLLQLVAERMRQNVRANDIVARLGGDEFAILQEYEPDQREAAISLAARLIEVLGTPYDLDGHQAMIGASIGVAIAAEGRETIEQLMHEADLALYQAKAQGRNDYRIYEDRLGSQAQERLQLENELREAISSSGLQLYYQPIVSLADEAICGMEALVRWRHPTRGLLAPNQFIPLAEETGLITPLGEFVIRQACLDASGWPEHVKVAVNISPTHLKKRSVMDTVTRALLKTRLAPERLEIEVTETVLIRENEDILAELHQLRSIGVSIALDDFGTGYSSLSHLRMFTFDKVKIDRSFVAEMTERSDSAAIVCAVAGLARSLDIITTAEGIETEEQLTMLKAAGCTQGQGYLFGRPRPAEESLSLTFSNMRLRQSA